MVVRTFAMGLLVDEAIRIYAADSAAGAVGTAFDTVFAEPQSRICVGPRGLLHGL